MQEHQIRNVCASQRKQQANIMLYFCTEWYLTTLMWAYVSVYSLHTWQQHGRYYFSILQHVNDAALEIFTAVGLQIARETDNEEAEQESAAKSKRKGQNELARASPPAN